MHKIVAQLMSVDFVTVTARMSLKEALLLLLDSDATELCVVDNQDRFEGVVTDFDLLKSQLNGQLTSQCVGSLISRAVTVLSAESPIEQVIPLFRDGSCSRAYVCRDGRLLGCLSRGNVLKHLTRRESVVVSSAIRTTQRPSNSGAISTINSREPTPPVPQFMTTSVLGGLTGERSRVTSRLPE